MGRQCWSAREISASVVPRAPPPLACCSMVSREPSLLPAISAYGNGTAEQFLNCYGPTWGRQKNRTRPAPGNHEYESTGAAPYFAYFGANAGPSGLGYYRYPSGPWQVYSLNSNMEGSNRATEMQWLRSELATQPSACSVAYFHHPLFSSGPHGLEPPVPIVRDLWPALYEAGVDIVISGHDHLYERFAPQDPDGRPDPEVRDSPVRGRHWRRAVGGGVSTGSQQRSRPDDLRSASAHARTRVLQMGVPVGGRRERARLRKRTLPLAQALRFRIPGAICTGVARIAPVAPSEPLVSCLRSSLAFGRRCIPPAALLVGQILPVFSLLAPCGAGASAPSVQQRTSETRH